ncbi:hypothetical protein D3C72_1906500 [compost metagenome]
MIVAKKAIHGFREPDSSAIEPRIGDSTAMMTDEIVAMLLQVAWAAIGSLVMRETKYGPKMKVVMTVKNGCAAQSNSIQPTTPRL